MNSRSAATTLSRGPALATRSISFTRPRIADAFDLVDPSICPKRVFQLGEFRIRMGQSVTPVAREARLLALSIDLLGAAGFDGYLKLHNPAWNRTLGYDDDELATTPYIELIHPDDQAAARSVIERMANGGTTIEFVCRIRRRDGMWSHILWSGQGAPDDGCFYIVGKDVTERRRLDQDLENRAERLERINA